jgi:hypothetical protein
MKFQKQKHLICFGLFVAACLVFTACGKKVTPQEVRRSRLDWNLKTTVGVYQEAGNTDAAWNEPATNALAEFARSRSGVSDLDDNWSEIIRKDCDAAVKAGCDDPMIRYLYIKFSMSQTSSPKDSADAFCKTADDMQQSLYPPIRKFYASLRALQQVYSAYGTNADQETIHELAQGIMNNLMDTLNDKITPPEEVYDVCHETLAAYSGGKIAYEHCYGQIEQPLFQNWPNESISWLLKGEAYIQMAWLARGSGYANGVTDEAWKSFRAGLATAEDSLEKAWKLNSKDERIPIQMIRVDEGQQKGRADMELWFNRAMAINPNSYQACEFKLHYLYPQWYGSREDMVAFGRECVASTNWGGNVPLILSDAHREYGLYLDVNEQATYWKRPDVWPDIKASFDRFFELNPGAIGYYHNYAWYAYHAEQWDALNEIIPKLGPINYNFFGGKDEFDKMVELAKEHAGKTSPAPQ